MLSLINKTIKVNNRAYDEERKLLVTEEDLLTCMELILLFSDQDLLLCMNLILSHIILCYT